MTGANNVDDVMRCTLFMQLKFLLATQGYHHHARNRTHGLSAHRNTQNDYDQKTRERRAARVTEVVASLALAPSISSVISVVDVSGAGAGPPGVCAV